MKLNGLFDWMDASNAGEASMDRSGTGEASLAPTEDSGSSSYCKDPSTSSIVTRIQVDEAIDERFCNDTVSILTSYTGYKEDKRRLLGEEQDKAAVFHRPKRTLRQRRAKGVRSISVDSSMWRYLDNFQLECLQGSDWLDPILPSMSIHGDDPWNWFERQNVKENDVVMTVEATALSEYDLQSGLQGEETKRVPGSNAVGTVHRCSPSAEESGVKPGMRVAAILLPQGSNARYLSLPSQDVLSVPRHLDAADISCITTAYLPAFQALHHGRIRPYRYSRSCLEGRRVLIVGGDRLVARATVRVAQLSGAKHVYISTPKAAMESLQKQNAFVLDEDPSNWPEQIDGAMDVVIDYQFPKNFADVRATLSRKGRLVCCNPANWSKEQGAWWADLSRFFECLQLSSIQRATLFDFRENYKANRYEVKEDLQFLLTALNRRHIRPEIDRYVKLNEIPRAYRDLKCKPRTGSIICEPWRY